MNDKISRQLKKRNRTKTEACKIQKFTKALESQMARRQRSRRDFFGSNRRLRLMIVPRERENMKRRFKSAGKFPLHTKLHLNPRNYNIALHLNRNKFGDLVFKAH